MNKINFSFVFRPCFILVIFAVASACASDFGDINNNPNVPSKATSDLVLTTVLRSTFFTNFTLGNESGLARHVAHTNYNEIEQYSFDQNQGLWNHCYIMNKNIDEIIKLAEQENNQGNIAKGYILKAYNASKLTDLWGDVPYYESNTNILTPAYDIQKEIYLGEGGILDLLRKAEEILSKSNAVSTDILYKGDGEKWRRLGNSLSLRYLIRISNRIKEIQEIDIVAEIERISKLPLMEENSDNAALSYLSTSPNMNPFYEMREGSFETYRMSYEMEQIYNKYQDPRIREWFAPTTNSVNTNQPKYKGVKVGLSSTSLTKIGYSPSEVSMVGSYYRNTPNKAAAIVITASEVKFLLAEAALKGFISQSVTDLYEDGVKLSIVQYTGDSSLAEEYCAQDGVKYDATRGIEQIIEQKWISLFSIGFEAWFDYLRTGLPKFEPLIDNRNPKAGEVPSRYYYPENEQTLNAENYNNALKKAGGKDDINTPLWWEMNN